MSDDDRIDTAAAMPSAADLRGHARQVRRFSARPDREPVPAGPPAAGAVCRYYLSVRNGKAYAVELEDGWIPTRVVGSFAGEQLRAEPRDQDWSDPTDARGWNVATLVPLCERERARMIEGVVRRPSRPVVASRVPLADRGVSDLPLPPAAP